MSVEAVSKAVQAERITVLVDGKGVRWLDPERADREWTENSDPSKLRVVVAADEPEDDEPKFDVDPSVPETLSYTASRARREAANAEIAELKLAELQGRLVAAADVHRAAFESARLVRESILGIPDRLAAQLAAESDANAAHSLLVRELQHALEELARGDPPAS